MALKNRKRVLALKRTRYYGENSQDRAGILRYTKVDESIFDLEDIPFPQNEREMAWILSFYWSLDRSYDEIALVLKNLNQGNVPRPEILITLSAKIKRAIDAGLVLPEEAYNTLNIMGL